MFPPSLHIFFHPEGFT